jgi:CHASE2 domain-containing sensor protein
MVRSYRYSILAGLLVVGLLSLGILIFHWLQLVPLVPVQVNNIIMVQPGVLIQEAIDKAEEGMVIELGK